MRYLLLIYGNETALRNLPREATGEIRGSFLAYTEALKKAGAYVGNNRLRPTSDARTVRAPGDKVSVLDGPFAETKEQLGGYYLIDVPDLEAALSWAKRCPAAAHGSVEVRPVWA